MTRILDIALDDVREAARYFQDISPALQRRFLAEFEVTLARISDAPSLHPAKTARTRFEHASPILNVANLGRSVRYYVDTLGFTNAEWGGDDFTCVTRDGASFYFSEGTQGQPGTWVWLGVEDGGTFPGPAR